MVPKGSVADLRGKRVGLGPRGSGTRAEVPRNQVDAMLKLVFETKEGRAGAAASQTSRGNAPTGVNLPWYEGAEAYYAPARTQ